MNQWKRALISLFVMLFALILDGVIAFYGGGVLNTATGIMVPRLTVLALVVLSNHLQVPMFYYLAIFFGFIYDSYYVGFFGIYTVGFFVIAYVFHHFWIETYASGILYTLAGLLAIVMIEIFAFAIYHILDITQWTLQEFIIFRLGATLVFNGVIMALFGWLLDRLMKKVSDPHLPY